jgi:hypothetical protein
MFKTSKTANAEANWRVVPWLQAVNLPFNKLAASGHQQERHPQVAASVTFAE